MFVVEKKKKTMVTHPAPGIIIAPVAYQVMLEPGIGQFLEFEPRRVHTRRNSLGLFLVDKLTCGKRDEQSTSSEIAEPYAR